MSFRGELKGRNAYKAHAAHTRFRAEKFHTNDLHEPTDKWKEKKK